jgi:Zn-dependent peptidase ImmA (M78 family)
VTNLGDAEQAAQAGRERLARGDGPLWELARVAEELGLFAFSLDVGDDRIDGTYAALEAGGVAIINGSHESGRRRFTLAHEIGHHVLQDEYATDWDAPAAAGDRERLVNAFAIHFLAPRSAIERRWQELEGPRDPWLAALRLAAEFGVSWTALCGQLANLALVDQAGLAQLMSQHPFRAAYLEHEIVIREDLQPPQTSPRYAAAVIKAYRTQRLGRRRAVELLFEAARDEDLPPLDRIPLESLRSDLQPLPPRA